ncbi:MAG: hypothetical protein COU33_00230 [Candidatus Magasanikbacteria bacterium CG10_big_fil_rev_8_21_14_0_10_43_6]|uniref:Glutathione synthetase n=1 Tax=Candidatus Magasanikbacteria bacterium CG10_big_fil_rev_8_21_14_0_10_43_6 TaxID=1974650 RepID=A0A2M6W2G3_9BACT|nr:MAG: hypothetical protein COU33_00230 [Candidatus Magasanikbacteria bacterium CG10_big_fil_rev_8_21_14_0_10_43_6]
MDVVTLIGLIAATCTTIAFIPQSLKIIKTKHTKDLSLGMYSILTLGIFLWLVYGVLLKNPPIIIANAISLVFCSTTLVLVFKYSGR